MRAFIRPATVVATLALVFGQAAATGQLDPGFGGGTGYVLLPLGLGDGADDALQDVIVDSAGRIVAAGSRTDTAGMADDQDFVVVRLLADGSLDPGFGNGGVRVVAFDLGGALEGAVSVFETADGRYVACGTAGTSDTGAAFAVVRLLGNGALDTSFDLDGRRTVFVAHPDGGGDFNQWGRCAGAPDGGIVVVGATYAGAGTSVAVLRLQADGSLDSGFNGSGQLVFDPAAGIPAVSLATDVLVQADGAIVLTGVANASTTSTNLDMFAARILADGSLDPDFGMGGVRLVAFDQGGSNVDSAFQLLPRHDGGFVLAGNVATALSGFDAAVVQLDAQGHPDPDFGTGGRVLLGLDLGGGLDESISSAAIDHAGRIYLAGSIDVAPDNHDVGVLRLTPSGVADPGFGVDGWALFGIDNPLTTLDERGTALALDALERPVVVGSGSDDADRAEDGLVLRLTGDHVFADGFEPVP